MENAEYKIKKTGVNFIGDDDLELYEWITARAARNMRSFSSEVKWLLREIHQKENDENNEKNLTTE